MLLHVVCHCPEGKKKGGRQTVVHLVVAWEG